jgi:hypothetical protein
MEHIYKALSFSSNKINFEAQKWNCYVFNLLVQIHRWLLRSQEARLGPGRVADIACTPK